MDEKKILIVANQTAGGAHLREIVRARHDSGPASFTLLVPAAHPRGGLTWTEGEAVALAEWRMNEALKGLREAGATIEGRVGDPRPYDAISDVLLEEKFDEVILSTLPPGASRWLKQDLPARVERSFDIPVTHVTGEVEEGDLLERVRASLGRTG
jgi:hypothetical protein